MGRPKAKEQEIGADGEMLNSLPLRKMHYEANVAGTQGHFSLRLDYENKLKNPVEARFVFPLPAEASVLQVRMKIGDKIVESKIKEKAQALAEYQAAVSGGHHASLLEQNRPNIFEMSVGGIEAGQKVEVFTEYFFPVEWQNGGGRLTVPLVVAPRFIPGNAIGHQAGGWSPDTDRVPDASKITPRVSDNVGYVVSGNIKLDPGFPAHIESPSHEFVIAPTDVERNVPHSIPFKDLRPDRDLIVTYQTQELLPTLKTDRSVFLGNNGAEQPEEFTVLQLTPGTAAKPRPTDVVLLLDCSGSMAGAKLDGLKQVAAKFLDKLTAFQGDVDTNVAIVAFNSAPREIARMQSIRRDKPLREALQQLQAGGGTVLSLGLEESTRQFDLHEREPGRERCILLISDGQTEDSVPRGIKNGIRIHGIGLDSAVNDALLKDLARTTGGSNYWIRPGEDYDRAASQMVSYVSGPVIRDLKIVGGPRDAEVAGLQDLYPSRPTLLAIRSKGSLRNCSIQGAYADGSIFELEIPAIAGETSKIGAALWAKMRMRELDDRDQIINLSLRYGILSAHTSFVAVSEKEVPGKLPMKVEIPVLLPEGWDFDAVYEKTAGFSPGAGAVRARSSGGHYLRTFSKPMPREDMGFYAAADEDLKPKEYGFSGMAKPLAPQPDDAHPISSSGLLRERSAPMRREIFKIQKSPGASSSLNEKKSGRLSRHELLERAAELLDLLSTGRRPGDAKARFAEIGKLLDSEKSKSFGGWSDEDRIRLCNTLVKLRSYGFKVALGAELTREPKDVAARPEWVKLQRTMGISVNL